MQALEQWCMFSKPPSLGDLRCLLGHVEPHGRLVRPVGHPEMSIERRQAPLVEPIAVQRDPILAAGQRLAVALHPQRPGAGLRQRRLEGGADAGRIGAILPAAAAGVDLVGVAAREARVAGGRRDVAEARDVDAGAAPAGVVVVAIARMHALCADRRVWPACARVVIRSAQVRWPGASGTQPR